MRQKNDLVYSAMLKRMRFGYIEPKDFEMIQKKRIPLKVSEDETRYIDQICEHLLTLPDDTVCLMSTVKGCDLINDTMINKINGRFYDIVAHDQLSNYQNNKKKKTAEKLLDSSEENISNTAGIPKHLKLKIGAKVMVRRNIDMEKGLVNGTMGSIQNIILDNNGAVDMIIIKIADGSLHKIERHQVKFIMKSGVKVLRTQFPLCLSYAITIHKSQGLSLKNALIDCGKNVFMAGQAYVAFSRLTSLEGLNIINFDPYVIKAHPKAITEYNRLRTLFNAKKGHVIHF